MGALTVCCNFEPLSEFQDNQPRLVFTSQLNDDEEDYLDQNDIIEDHLDEDLIDEDHGQNMLL